MPERDTPKAWSDWYRFARDEFGFGHDECVEYANLRFVEEQNRASLRARRDAADAAATPAGPGSPPE